MTITSTGFKTKRFPEVLDDIVENLSQNLAVDVNTTSDTVLGVLVNVLASSISEQEDLLAAVVNNLNIDSAEGVFLDRLVGLAGLKRLGQSYTIGTVYPKASANNTVLPSGTQFKDSSSNKYTSFNDVNISTSNCTYVKIIPNSPTGTYTVTINGTPFSVTYTEPQVYSDISNALKDVINASAPTLYAVELDGDNLIIQPLSKFNALDVSVNINLSVVEVETPVSVKCTVVGSVNPSIGQVNSIVTNSANIISVTNYDTFVVGRDLETDSELRTRHRKSSQLSGNGTLSSIYSHLSNIEGVSLVRIFENSSDDTDGEGRPPHSFECIVEGGDPNDIATTIWNSKPVSVSTYGTGYSLVEDYSGSPQSVYWSRPVLKYINVRVTYTLYDEETPPDDLVNTIKKVITEYGDSLGLDKDVIPQRLLVPIYSSIDGLGSVTIEIGTSYSPTSALPDQLPYQTSKISISSREKADFDPVRIQVVQA